MPTLPIDQSLFSSLSVIICAHVCCAPGEGLYTDTPSVKNTAVRRRHHLKLLSRMNRQIMERLTMMSPLKKIKRF